MKKINLLFTILFIAMYGFSQDIHTPAEILKIMEDSKLTYTMEVLKNKIESKDYSEKLNLNTYYRVKTDSGLITYEYKINDDTQFLFDKAEKFFQSENYDEALENYKLALFADSTFYKVMTYIGQIYGLKGDYNNAIKWYKKAIEKNYIDYMAHWFLADTYLEQNDLNNAVDEIVIAQILNRNNPRIKKALIKIFEKAKRSTEDWYFTPQIVLERKSDENIRVGFDDKWTGYAIAKAIWAYEPGYKESMGVSEGEKSTLEEKECLISLLVGLENGKKKTKKDPQLRILKEALDKKYFTEYILYEIMLTETPFIAYQLSEEMVLNIKDYILMVRNPK